ncbi:DHH family phosphoesterase [Candidatus Berkelbacteria bacterium]|nr:DHH family phosphoesterase [Candidatus Berkelbacteria bacterium]
MAEVSPKQQIVDALALAKRVLIIISEAGDGDSVGSALALAAALKKLDKEAMIFSPEPPQNKFQFIANLAPVSFNGQLKADFLIEVSCQKAQPETVSYRYQPETKTLLLTIAPKTGQFEPADVKVLNSAPKFDLVFVLDTPGLKQLGALHDQNSQLFFETPTINIDHHAQNEHFAKINLVDLTATSTAEILVSLLESLAREKPLLDSEIATALLLGIIFDTNSFQNQNTTPKALTVAAQLVAAQARKEVIIQNLYKSKSLAALKLWGLVLSALNFEPQLKLVWAKVREQDFLETKSSPSDLEPLLRELLAETTEARLFLVLFERANQIEARLLINDKTLDLTPLMAVFDGKVVLDIGQFTLPLNSLAMAEQEVLTKLTGMLAESQRP